MQQRRTSAGNSRAVTCGQSALAQVRLEARLQFAERRNARIRLVIRHAPTGRPLDRRVSPQSQAAKRIFLTRPTIRAKIGRPATLSRLSFNPLL
jgi:hypothetical protein